MPNITYDKKWVIFDTCTISKMHQLRTVSPIMNKIKEKIGIFTPTITPLVRFEYLRFANNKRELEKFSSYLNENYVEIPISSKGDRYDIYKYSAELANVYFYSDRGHAKNIGPIDYIHGGLLKRYPLNLYLLTFDPNDFPQPIYECIIGSSAELKNRKIEKWILCKFNSEEYQRYYKLYNPPD